MKENLKIKCLVFCQQCGEQLTNGRKVRENKFCNKKCYGLFMRGKSLDRVSPSKKEYIRIVKKDSPLADKQGKVLLHRQVFYETKDVLFSDEIVHHKDENKRNNSPENLEKLRRDEHTPNTHKNWKKKTPDYIIEYWF